MGPRPVGPALFVLLLVAGASASDLGPPPVPPRLGAHREAPEPARPITEQPGPLAELEREGTGQDLTGGDDEPVGPVAGDGGLTGSGGWVEGRPSPPGMGNGLKTLLGRHRALEKVCPDTLGRFPDLAGRHQIACNACRLKYMWGTMEGTGLTEAQRAANRAAASAEIDALSQAMANTISDLEALPTREEQRDPSTIVSLLLRGLADVGSERSKVYREATRLLGWSPPAEGLYVCEQIGCCEPPRNRKEAEVARVRKILTKKGQQEIARVTGEWLEGLAKESQSNARSAWGSAMSMIGFGPSARQAEQRCLMSEEGFFQYRAAGDLTQITRDLTRPSFFVAFTVSKDPDVREPQVGHYRAIGQGLEYFFLCGGVVLFTQSEDAGRFLVHTAIKADMAGRVPRPSQYGKKLSEADADGESGAASDGATASHARGAPGDTHDDLEISKGLTRDIHRFLSAVIATSAHGIDGMAASLAAAYKKDYESYVQRAAPGEPAILAHSTTDFLAIHVMMMASQDLGNKISLSMAPASLFAQTYPTAPYPIYQALNLADPRAPLFNINIWFRVMDRTQKESMPLNLSYRSYLGPLEEAGVPIRIQWFPGMLGNDVRDQAEQILRGLVVNNKATCQLVGGAPGSDDSSDDDETDRASDVVIPESDGDSSGGDEVRGGVLGVRAVTEAMDRAAVRAAGQAVEPHPGDADVDMGSDPFEVGDMRIPTIDLDRDDELDAGTVPPQGGVASGDLGDNNESED